MADYKVLGTLELMAGQRVCTPTSAKVRSVLALLVLSANRVVAMDSLIDEIWGDEPPASAVTTIQTYIYHLRKLFERENLSPDGRDLLVTKAPGYVLRVAPGQVDSEVFEQLTTQGQQLLAEAHPEQAAVMLRRALDLWTGAALANVQLGSLLQAHVVHLEERRISALESRIQADIELGRHRELISELKALVATHPLHEWFHAQLIAALGSSGRRGEALQSYQHLRVVLRDELGVDPSSELQRLQCDILQGVH
jgi:DNA-binding SARP family transcriptional activator